MSLGLSFVKLAIKIMRGPKRSHDSIHQKYHHRTPPKPKEPSYSILKVADVQAISFENRLIYQMIPKMMPRIKSKDSSTNSSTDSSTNQANNLHLIYLHGGGFVNPLVKAHWDICASLIKATSAEMSMPIYPLAPENDHRDALNWLIHAYEAIISQAEGKTIVLCGDSAGGNLVLTLCITLKKMGIALPKQCILFCPWVDLSMSNPLIEKLAHRDVMLKADELLLCATWWANGLKLDDPTISPVYAKDSDLIGLPPMQIFLGSDDILTPDAQILAQRLKSLGLDLDLHLTERGFHDFMGAPFLREAKVVYQLIALKLIYSI
jgi:monoterpene epsilon-lactone hydrolase